MNVPTYVTQMKLLRVTHGNGFMYRVLGPTNRTAAFLSRASYSTASCKQDVRLHRSYLYVPSSSQRMLQKSLQTTSDMIIYDLEDSVAPAEKIEARQSLLTFLNTNYEMPLLDGTRIAARINAIGTPFFEDDLKAIVQTPQISTLILPKIHSPDDLDVVSNLSVRFLHLVKRTAPIRIVASIESARAVWNIGRIAEWRSEVGLLTALLFAAEDYCADTSIIRTPSRTELLFTRSQISLAAKTFGLDAVDMVCVNYKDIDYLRDECEDGRRLGFNGKQAIHPTQVDIINRCFVPTEKEILRAATIVAAMEASHRDKKGAFGLDMGDGKGSKEMIDAPMLKQAENTLKIAEAAALHIPKVYMNKST